MTLKRLFVVMFLLLGASRAGAQGGPISDHGKYSTSSANLGNIDRNFWGGGVIPAVYGSPGCSNCVWNSGTMTIEGNFFTATQSTLAHEFVDDEDNLSAAIAIENTTANVLDNTITDKGWLRGIYILGSDLPDLSGPLLTLSLLCLNTITGLQTNVVALGSAFIQKAIESEYYKGYVKLNSITDNDVSYLSETNDNPRLIFNSMTGSKSFGIWVKGPSAEVDLSGVHDGSALTPDLAAVNTITGPSRTIDGTHPAPGLLVLAEAGSQFDLSNYYGPTWSNFGQNDISVSSSPTSPTMPILQSITGSSINIHSIDDNFWGAGSPVPVNGLDPSVTSPNGTNWTFSPHLISSEVDAHDIDYTATSGTTGLGGDPSLSFGFSGISCGDGTGLTMPQLGKVPKSKLDIDSVSCYGLDIKVHNYNSSNLYQQLYDTSKRFVEQCPHDVPDVIRAFSYMTDAVQRLGFSDPLRAEYFAWLKSVLYLNTKDPEYFCACVEAIAGELPGPKTYWPDTGFNYPLAVQQWLIQNTNCDSASLRELYTQTRKTQYEMWSNNPNAYKLDTTLPTMQQLGLDTLLAKHFQYAWVPSGGDFGKHVSSYSVSENPLHDMTTLRFDLSDAEYVRVQVFDLLGSTTPCPSLQKSGEGLFESGQHEIPIDFSRCASGTYYLRITLGTGEVRTVKLVKE